VTHFTSCATFPQSALRKGGATGKVRHATLNMPYLVAHSGIVPDLPSSIFCLCTPTGGCSGQRTAAAAFDFGLTREGRGHRGKVHTSTAYCARRAACLCLLESLFAELRSVWAGGAVFVISDGDGDEKTVATRAATLALGEVGEYTRSRLSGCRFLPLSGACAWWSAASEKTGKVHHHHKPH